MKITIALKRIDNQFEAALIVNERFARATTGQQADATLNKLLAPMLTRNWRDGDEIVVNVAIEDGEPDQPQKAGA